MTPIFAYLQPFDIAAAQRIEVRLADGPTADTYGTGGIEWFPAITERPVMSLETMSPDLDGKVLAGRARLSFNASMLGLAARQIKWAGAAAAIYSAKDLAWPPVTEFDGFVIDPSVDIENGLVSLVMEVSTEFLEGPLLTASFTGGGGLTGEADKRGTLKPAGFGAVENIEPVWFDTTRWIGMIDGYANTTAITRLMEGLDDRGARVANYASYALLAAAIDAGTVPPGRWATCVAEGLVGLGAPPAAPITVNATFGSNRLGAIMKRILQVHRGVPIGNIDTAAFDAMDVTVNYAARYWTSEQRDVKELIEAMAGSINATPLVTFQKKVSITRGTSNVATATMNKDGSTLPRVVDSKPLASQKPIFRLRARAARPARVLSYEEVLFADTIEDKGVYDNTATYRAGHVVWSADKSSWLYINATPDKGHAPPAWPTTANAYWQNLTPPATASGITYADGTPIENLKPAAAGADPTATNISAGFTGQGALSLLSTVNGGVVDPNSITNYNLAAAPGNAIQNSDFATGDFTGMRPYSTPGGHSVVARGSVGVPANAPTANVARYDRGGSAGAVSTFLSTKAYSDFGAERDGFAVLPGQRWRVSADMAAGSAWDGSNVNFYAYFLRDDGTLIGPTIGFSVLAGDVPTSWTRFSGGFVVPARCIRCWLYFYAGGMTNAVLYWTNPFADRVREVDDLAPTAVRLGTNVVRNNGSTSVGDADAITLLGISSGFTGQGTLATLNQAAWGANISGRPTELTDGRVSAGLDASGDLARNIAIARANASNLLRYATGGLFTGQLAADVTASNIAAGFTGQGALATLASISWSGGLLTGRPTELTDGRIAAGLDASGDLARNIALARANASNLLRFASGGLYVGSLSADVTAANISAGFAGQGALAVLNSVSGAVIDPSSITNYNLAQIPGNLIQNADFATGDFTGMTNYNTPASQTVVAKNAADVPAGAPTNFVAQHSRVGTAASVGTFLAGRAYSATGADKDGFAVTPGDTYRVAIHVTKAAGAAFTSFNVQAYFLKNDGTYTTSVVPITILAASVPTAWGAPVTGTFVAPAGTLRCWLYVLTGSMTAGKVFWTLPFATRVNRVDDLLSNAVQLGTNITRNDGSTPLTDALAVTSLGISSGFTGQASIATDASASGRLLGAIRSASAALPRTFDLRNFETWVGSGALPSTNLKDNPSSSAYIEMSNGRGVDIDSAINGSAIQIGALVDFPVVDGTIYEFEADIEVLNANGGTSAYLYFRVLDKDFALLGNFTGNSALNLATNDKRHLSARVGFNMATPGQVTTNLTTPGAAFIRVLLLVNRSAASTGANIGAKTRVTNLSQNTDLFTGKSVTLFGDRLATNFTYVSGTTLEALKPAQAGANVTGLNVAASVTGQGPWATTNTGTIGNPGTVANQVQNLNTSTGFFASFAQITERKITQTTRADGTTTITESMTITSLGIAAGFSGQGSLATANSVDLSNAAQVLPRGSIPPVVPDNGFTYTSTTTTVTINWPSMTLYRPDGTTITIASGSQAINSLGANTQYKVYPYVVDTGGGSATMAFVASASSPNYGVPAICYPNAGSYLARVQANQSNRIDMNAFTVVTTASGSGGGGGGGWNCIHEDMAFGATRAGDLREGDTVESPDGPATINKIQRASSSEWYELYSGDEMIAKVTSRHLLYLALDGREIMARDVRLGDILRAADKHVEITGLRLCTREATAIGIGIADPHLHFLGPQRLLCHNGTQKP